MGFVNVKVTLRNSEEPDRKEELEMVVDMAMYIGSGAYLGKYRDKERLSAGFSRLRMAKG